MKILKINRASNQSTINEPFELVVAEFFFQLFCTLVFVFVYYLFCPLFPEVLSLFTLWICQRHALKAFSEPFLGIALLHLVFLMLPCSNLLKLSKSCRFESCFQGNFFIKSPKFIGVIWWLKELFGIFGVERQCFF
jgi:hypothetical protein